MVTQPPDHLPGWEYLYLASEIARGITEHEGEYQEYVGRVVQPTGEVFKEPAKQMSQLSTEAGLIVSNVERIFSTESLQKALGPPGHSGNEEAIREVARDVTGVYSSMIAWAQRIRGASVSTEWRPASLALANMVSTPLREMRDFSAQLSRVVTASVADLRAGKAPSDPISLTLAITIPDSDLAAFKRALGDAERAITGSQVREGSAQ